MKLTGNYEIDKTARLVLEKAVTEASKRLKSYSTYSNGLTPDSVKFTDEYQKDREISQKAFTALQNFNKQFVKTHKMAIRAERRNKNK